jgi:uncharacterized membrane protein YeaQ/YmgE (transglycosylase-associated protein family)
VAAVSIGTLLALPAFGLVLGALARLLVPRPSVVGCLLTGLAGLVGGLAGVLLGSRIGLGAVLGAVLAALFVALACGWAAFRRGPYPPHDRVPRSYDPEDVRRAGSSRAAPRRRGRA